MVDWKLEKVEQNSETKYQRQWYFLLNLSIDKLIVESKSENAGKNNKEKLYLTNRKSFWNKLVAMVLAFSKAGILRLRQKTIRLKVLQLEKERSTRTG